ncbi:hypothetical protein K2X85_13550 [bacterium]|nr:hypothetical protein [bacterium]
MNTIRFSLFCASIALLIGSSAHAAPTVKLSLFVDELSPNTFNLYAESSLGDNAGIAFYSAPLLGGITSLDHKSPVANALLSGPPFFSALGFNTLRSADGALTVLASQDTISAGSTLVYGMGQVAGNLATLPGVTSLLPGSEQPAYAAKLLIASGTYSGALPSFNLNSVDLVANVFAQNGSRQVVSATVQAVVVPEASTVVMMGMVAVAIVAVAVRRRASC